jgi:5-oxoprolinase (ATP-hydrolysing)
MLPGNGWHFWIDVGGTFTDCLATSPNNEVHVFKVLSSGVVKTTVQRIHNNQLWKCSGLHGFPKQFFKGYFLREQGSKKKLGTISSFNQQEATISVDLTPPESVSEGKRLELFSDEPAPLLAIRMALGIQLDDPIGKVMVRLGTTRATNALLERKGAKTALLITKGFKDLITIGTQNRPELFVLNVKRSASLFDQVIEIQERIDAKGNILIPLDRKPLHDMLVQLRHDKFESLAICLMNAYKNPSHEIALREFGHLAGFNHVSVSHQISPTIKIIPRGETTIVDAYLTPVLRQYISFIQRRLPEGQLRLINSAGGLVACDHLKGKDMILSGPAGGVVGVARVTEEAGLNKAIGFDMGGTSTDVCRYDGRFDYEHESVKAGVRLVAPMLAIETVAAGGGSICSYDGYRLVVGPESAGADPGPACYGARGPLTVTDMNLFLGRIYTERFPFSLDKEIVVKKLEELSQEIHYKTGQKITSIQIAEGFLKIANTNMATAIQKISLQKGYDIRDYCLISFGGAAAQHACAVANELGISQILIHSYSGVLSAYGAGMADIRIFAVRTLLEPYQEHEKVHLEGVFQELQEEVSHQFLSENLGTGILISIIRQLEMRYRGQGTTITVPEHPERTFQQEFERLHMQLYGYIFASRSLEVVTARLELIATSPKKNKKPTPLTTAPPLSLSTHEMVFSGESHRVPLFDWNQLRPGNTIIGPALISEKNSMIVVEKGWEARFSERKDLVLTKIDGEEQEKPLSTDVDHTANPIELELFNRHFSSIAEQMGTTLRRTALSVNVKERLDYSCALFDTQGDLIVNAPHMPVHLGAMSESLRQTIADVESINPGDVLLTNDPMRGGSHIPDITVITPVFDQSNIELLFFVANRAHHAEIGGIQPGSMPSNSKNLAEEGILLHGFKVIEKGHARYKELRGILTSGNFPSRAPDDNICDIEAQVAANRTGVEALLSMVAHHGKRKVQNYIQHIQNAAERKMRDAIRKLPDDIYTFSDQMDNGATIKASITIEDSNAIVDFSRTSPVQSGNLNANRAIVTAAVLYCFRCLIKEDIPLNSGVLKPIRIILPTCFLNPPVMETPKQCAAVVGGNVETSQRCVDVIFGALGVVAASQGTMNNLTFGNKTFGYYETICGGTGAGATFHGCDAIQSHMTNTRLTDPEVLEAQFPVRLIRFEKRPESGGKGRYTGGDGTIRELEFLEPVELSMLSQRRTTAPYGLQGGEPGEPGENILIKKDSQQDISLSSCFTESLSTGDRLVIKTPGGGGFGRKEK